MGKIVKFIFIYLIFSFLIFSEEKTIILSDFPDLTGRNFEVSDNGEFLYFGAGENAYTIIDSKGKLVGKIGCPSAPRELIPLPNGWFIAAISHANGHIAFYRPDGTYYKAIVGRGNDEKHLRSDMTGWTSPCGIAVDYENKLIFAIDTTMAPPNFPDPDWSRIVIFDIDGNYIRDINRYDCKKQDADDTKRTWYEDIEVDPKLKIVYVSARRFNEIWAFSYEGELLGKIKGFGKIGVFNDSRVVFSPDGKGLGIYRVKKEDKKLVFEEINYIGLPENIQLYHPWGFYVDIETDKNGNLYISTPEKTMTFIKWSPDFKNYEIYGPDYLRIKVEFPSFIFPSGSEINLNVDVEGRPEIKEKDKWRVKVRSSDGRDLKWEELESYYNKGNLKVKIKEDLKGIYEICVKYGESWIDWINREKEPYIQKTIGIYPENVKGSICIISQSGRRNFLQGEKIDLAVIKRQKEEKIIPLRIILKKDGKGIFSRKIEVLNNFYFFIPSEITELLLPGEYEIEGLYEGHEVYPFKFCIVSNQKGAEIQRILYHEFPNEPITEPQKVSDIPESLSYINDYLEEIKFMNFNRETIRTTTQGAWRRDYVPVDVSNPAFAVPEYYGIPPLGGQNWHKEFYLDCALKYNVSLDLQILYHCAHAVYIPEHLEKYIPLLQIFSQWLMKYPSFYGFNYNDEMFFGGWGWTAEMQQYGDKPQKWLKEKYEENFKGKPWADVLLFALETMYGNFNKAVREIRKDLKITTTPMWQYPAVEGSYAPTIYKDMDESYSHFLSEGYHIPFYAPHSADFLRRPDLPLMGVFDNNYGAGEGDIYVKNANLVLGRGVNGIGVQHTRPFNDWNSSYLMKVVNELSIMYGGIYSKSIPLNEAAILYSYTQDVKEQRNCLGTPHWEKVWAIYAAGLMAGLPMSIVYEEDILDGYLFNEKGEIKFPMLFLIGIKDLPVEVKREIDKFVSKGGRVFSDEESIKFDKILHLENFYENGLKKTMWEGYAADSWFPLLQPILEGLALKIKKECNDFRRFPVDTDNFWISKNIFDGGEIKYIHFASEMAPYPWKPEDTWFLGNLFRKGYLPLTFNLVFPNIKNAKIYDVYEHKIVQPEIKNGRNILKVNLINYSGKLYAIIPEGIGFPDIKLTKEENKILLTIGVKNKKGNFIKGIVPFKVELLDRNNCLIEKIYRTTERNGFLKLVFPLFFNETKLTLRVTELIEGNSRDVEINFLTTISGDFIVEDNDVKVFRIDNIKNILKGANKEIVILIPSEKFFEKIGKIREIFEKRGIKVKLDKKLQPVDNYFIALGSLNKKGWIDEIIEKSISLGICDIPITKNTLGEGRSLITAIYSIPSVYKKGIIILGGDENGLDKGIKLFEEFLQTGEFPKLNYKFLANTLIENYKIGKEYIENLEGLEEKVGIKIKDIKISNSGKYILIGANTYCKNIALIEDKGNDIEIIRAERIGHSEEIHDLYLGEEGKKFGASVRTIDEGEVFYLYDALKEKLFIFPSFGDSSGCSYGVSEDGNTLIVGGKYGIICYKFKNEKWEKIWSWDYWKEFDKLDWPISNDDERNPQFSVKIPKGKDYAIVLFSETTNNGWITPDHFYKAAIFKVNIESGKIMWKYEWKENELYFPSLILSENGEVMVINLQIGSWGREKRKIFLFNSDGEKMGEWNVPSGFIPIEIKIDEKNKMLGIIYAPRRILEIRDFDGKILMSLLWKNQPISLDFLNEGIVFSDDGGRIVKVDYSGNIIKEKKLGFNIKKLYTNKDRIYAIGYNGFLIVYGKNLEEMKKIDVDKFLYVENPMEFTKNIKVEKNNLIEAGYSPTIEDFIPQGEEKIKRGIAIIKIGGTPGWMSEGKIEVKEEVLKNGEIDDVKNPWLNLDELFWDALSGRQIWIEIEFVKPEDVKYLTIYENPDYPKSWIKESVVQVWNEDRKKWETVKFGIFLKNPINTYELNLKNVKKIRFVPLSNYFKNFYISEVEVR